MDSMKLICKYRSHLMGIAMLWVMLFHSESIFENQILYFIKLTGYGGVDIFMFLSGVGVYYSLEKNGDIMQFYKRRMFRLLPSYIPFLILWFTIMMAINGGYVPVGIAIQEFFGNLLMTGWITGLEHQFNWYIQTVFWFYIFTPVIYLYINNKSLISDFGTIIFLCIFGVPFLGKTTLMATSRIPVFVLGMMAAGHERFYLEKISEKVISIVKYVLALAGVGILVFTVYRREAYLWKYGMWWYPFLLITPGLCIFLSRIFERISRWKLLTLILDFLEGIGKSSFEIYLLHIALFELIKDVMMIKSNWIWLLLIFAAIILGMLYYKLTDTVRKYMFRRVYVKNERKRTKL